MPCQIRISLQTELKDGITNWNLRKLVSTVSPTRLSQSWSSSSVRNEVKLDNFPLLCCLYGCSACCIVCHWYSWLNHQDIQRDTELKKVCFTDKKSKVTDCVYKNFRREITWAWGQMWWFFRLKQTRLTIYFFTPVRRSGWQCYHCQPLRSLREHNWALLQISQASDPTLLYKTTRRQGGLELVLAPCFRSVKSILELTDCSLPHSAVWRTETHEKLDNTGGLFPSFVDYFLPFTSLLYIVSDIQ